MSLYKPAGSVFLSELQDSQCRLAFQAPAFGGKTTAALKWPNPTIISYDRKVTAHLDRTDVAIIPFYDGEYLDKYLVRRNGINCKPNRKDSLIKFLTTEALKLSPEQTLIFDLFNSVDASFHIWFEENKDELAYSKKGEFNKFIEWDLKKKYFEEVFDAIRALKCDVIATFWEMKDEESGKIKSLITGQTGAKLGGNFTDWLAVRTVGKPVNDDQRAKLKQWAGIDDATLKEWIASTPPQYQAIHLFQTQADGVYESVGSSSLHNAPKYIIADHTNFQKYRKKISPSTINQG